ncbi:MAG TPA: LPS export ABC transporter periplasmic protein LptC [Candidatus Aquilonibacter sp.]|nr:LPS export ABC transporter periplasmic protein LptC [Candidatus Aquilonibacter sp.]
MPLPVYRVRRLLAALAVIFTVIIAGMYLSARLREHNVLNEVPGKIGYEIKQTANGFQLSKSESGRTLFTVHAQQVKEFKLDGRAELHKVNIVLYGRDSSRFDQISGDNFSYDPKTGDVTARGEVQIDLEANPQGIASPDQAAPTALKNPIHLKTTDLIFNKDSGDATTDARVDFRTPQATGWAVGVHYLGKSKTLIMDSQVHVTLNKQAAPRLFAIHGVYTSEPHQLVLDQPRLVDVQGTVRSDQATFFLGADNEVNRILATGNVESESAPAAKSGAAGTEKGSASLLHARADQADLLLTGTHNEVRLATLTGNVQAEQTGPGGMHGTAPRVIVNFAAKNKVRTVHAAEGVRLWQHAAGATHPVTGSDAGPQDFELTAPIVDFFVAEGRYLDHALTSGAAQITISPAQSQVAAGAKSTGQQLTIITAGKFEAKFVPTADGQSRLDSMHGAPEAKIVNMVPGQPDRVSTSATLDARFLSQGGIDSIVQQGNVVFTDNQSADKRTQAWGDRAHYTPADQILVLTGNPKVAQGSMITTARIVRLNRATGDAFADGDVRSTYSDVTEQPNGALLASSSPIHVTAASMTAHNSPAIAFYHGNARLWQDANLVEAPSIQFDRERRFVVAHGTANQPVSTVLVQAPNASQVNGEHNTNKRSGGAANNQTQAAASTVRITSEMLTYSDAEHLAHYEGDVVARGADFTATSKVADAYLVPRAQTSKHQALGGPAQLDHIVATGNVVIVQPTRRAVGQKLVYTAADDRYVLTGGSPSIFDAERGTITGVSLTFYNRDDRVLVEGEASTPVVTQTRVAR